MLLIFSFVEKVFGFLVVILRFLYLSSLIQGYPGLIDEAFVCAVGSKGTIF
jgi:hypothetical protein